MKTSYLSFDSFVIRTPLFPFNSDDEYADIKSDVFREAIFLASPELYEGNNSSDEKKKEKFELSLMKYYQRARSRCTPFGLFAGCSVGTLDNETDVRLYPILQYQRCTRLDMQYLCALIQRIEKLPEVRRQITYYPNDSIYKIGGKYRYIEYHYQQAQRLHEVVSLEIDDPLEIILATAHRGTTMQNLIQTLVAEGFGREDAESYLNEIIDAQVLKSDLDPSVVGEDVLGTLIRKLSLLKNIKVLGILQRIQSILSDLDSQPVGSTIPLYPKITELIKKTDTGFEAKFLFQTDMFKPTYTAKVSKTTVERLSGLINFLSRITAPRDIPALSDFMSAFQERYGEQEVPLAEALDRELGIGYATENGNNGDVSPLLKGLNIPGRVDYYTVIRQSPLDKVLLRKFIECINTRKDTVQLSDDDFEGFSFEHHLPDTFTVMCSVINQTQLYVSNIGGSCGANLLSRFSHSDKKIAKLVEKITEFEQKCNPDVIYAEISHLPESRIGNIVSRPVLRNYTLHYLSNCSHDETDISITDLMLSIRKARLYLRSKKYNKEVFPRLTCAHNYSLSPIPVYRFLSDIQFQGKTGGFRCGWNAPLTEMDYLPRIQYKDIIIARQQWKVSSHEVEGFESLSDDDLIKNIQSLMEKRRMPSRVVVPDADNELYLDLSKIKCIRLFLSLISKRKQLVLEEFLFQPDSAVVCQENNKFTNEMIFVFHK